MHKIKNKTRACKHLFTLHTRRSFSFRFYYFLKNKSDFKSCLYSTRLKSKRTTRQVNRKYMYTTNYIKSNSLQFPFHLACHVKHNFAC